MKIIFLGTGTLSPYAKRTAAGIIIKLDTNLLLLDSGSGVYYKIAKAGIDFHKISHFFYTHYEHPDHVNDLPFILFAKKYDTRENKSNITMTGPSGFCEFIKNLKTLYPNLQELPFETNIREMHNEEIIYDTFSIKTKPSSHGKVSSVAYRIECNNKSIVYTGDTDYCKNIVELARDADILIADSSFPDQLKIENHLSPGFAGKIASESGAKKLILTHFYPQCDEYDILSQAAQKFNGEIIISEDMMQIEL
ncbi:MAG: MBL fold metallo-hydrolase [Spirochaetes bacterium]|nr:MBL fold metallo-hydrolase [Spirochaetota bacterium]